MGINVNCQNQIKIASAFKYNKKKKHEQVIKKFYTFHHQPCSVNVL